jgi:hypothetical protein
MRAARVRLVPVKNELDLLLIEIAKNGQKMTLTNEYSENRHVDS